MELPSKPVFDLSHLGRTQTRYIEALHTAAFAVVRHAIELIPVNIPGLDYHTRRHSEEDVTGGFIELGVPAVEQGKITMEEFYIGLVGAGTHDLVYEKRLIGTGENEARSTEEAIGIMKKHKVFSLSDMDRVKAVHDATIFKGAGKNGIVQCATEGDFLEELITDVDTGGIGMTWEFAKDRIDNYYRELNGKEPDENDEDYVNFLHFQVDVLTGHSYKTEEGRIKYCNLDLNANLIKAILHRIA